MTWPSPAFARLRLLPARHDHGHLGLAADQRRQVLVLRFETALRGGDARDPVRLDRLDDAFQRLFAHIRQLEGAAQQAPRRWPDDDLVGPGQPLQPRRQVRRLTHRQLRYRGIAGAGLAHHHRAGGDADTHLQRHGAHGLDNVQRGPHRPFRIVLVRLGPAEIGHQPVAEILRHMTAKALDDLARRLLIRLHQRAQILRIEPFGQCRRAHQIAEHHRNLPPLRLSGLCWHRRRLLGGLQHQLAVAHGQAEILEAAVVKIADQRRCDVLGLEGFGMLVKP